MNTFKNTDWTTTPHIFVADVHLMVLQFYTIVTVQLMTHIITLIWKLKKTIICTNYCCSEVNQKAVEQKLLRLTLNTTDAWKLMPSVTSLNTRGNICMILFVLLQFKYNLKIEFVIFRPKCVSWMAVWRVGGRWVLILLCVFLTMTSLRQFWAHRQITWKLWKGQGVTLSQCATDSVWRQRGEKSEGKCVSDAADSAAIHLKRIANQTQIILRNVLLSKWNVNSSRFSSDWVRLHRCSPIAGDICSVGYPVGDPNIIICGPLVTADENLTSLDLILVYSQG